MRIYGITTQIEEYGTPHVGATDVDGVVIVGYDPNIDKWMALKWEERETIWLVGGGREKSETYVQAASRELKEETGYVAASSAIQLGGPIISHYFNDKKAVYRRSYALAYLFLLDSTHMGEQELEAHEKFSVIWLEYEALRRSLAKTGGGVEHWLAILGRAQACIADPPLGSFN